MQPPLERALRCRDVVGDFANSAQLCFHPTRLFGPTTRDKWHYSPLVWKRYSLKLRSTVVAIKRCGGQHIP